MNPGPYREYVTAVRSASSLRDIIIAYKVGVNEANMVVCPFHADTRPSLSVNIPSQLFHCFGCGVSGDVFTFVERMDGVDFKTAVDTLARLVNVRVYTPMAKEREVVDWERAVAEATDQAVGYYQAQMERYPIGKAYLASRGLPPDLIAQFRLGWADGGLVAATNLGPALERAGLAKEVRNATGWTGPVHHDWFVHRVIFPCLRLQRGVFLSGRTAEAGVEPKYLHQKGTEAPLYNEEAINPTATFVVEGPIDVLSLEAWGFPTVGLQGGVRPSAIPKLRRSTVVYSVLDADRAGRESLGKLTAGLGPHAVRAVALPEGQDPNDFYRTGTKTQFEDLVAQTQDPVLFMLGRVQTASGELPERVDPLLHLLAALMPVQAEYYWIIIKDTLGLDRRMISACQKQTELYRTRPAVCPACRTPLTSWRA